MGCEQEPPPAPEHPALKYRFTKHLQGHRFSPEGTHVLHEANEATGDTLLKVALADGTSETVTTAPPGQLQGFSYFPGRPMLLWAMGPAGKAHQFARTSDGLVTDLTPGDNVNTMFYGWSDDGSSFFYGSNRADRRFLYLHKMNAATLKFDVALQTQDTHFVVAAPNQRYIALIKPSPGLGAEMFTYDFEVRKLNRLSPVGAGHLEIAQFFSPDSQALFFLSDVDSGYLHLRRRPLGEGEPEDVFPGAVSGNVLYARRSNNGKYLVLGVGVGSGSTANPVVLNGEDGTPAGLQGFDGVDWDVLDISGDERLMTYSKRGGAAGNLSVYEFESGEHRTLRP
jgi:Tol biopolymer transport system component